MEKYYGNCDVEGNIYVMTALIDESKTQVNGEGKILSLSNLNEEIFRKCRHMSNAKLLDLLPTDLHESSLSIGERIGIFGEISKTPEDKYTFKYFEAYIAIIEKNKISNKHELFDDNPNLYYIEIEDLNFE